ncbi:uncharacterized protein LOC144362389 [Saccoglossus kowalevskii]
MRMRRYREKLKNKRKEKYQEMLKHDRERKKLARIHEKVARQKNKGKLLKVRETWRISKQKYRETIKGKRNSSATQKKKNKKDGMSDREKRKIAVLRTQSWRLRVKLQEKKSIGNEKTPKNMKKRTSPFSSRTTEFRAVKKVKSSLPKTPSRRSRVIEKLVQSPNTRKILEEEGLLLNKSACRQLKLGLAVMNSVKGKVEEIRASSKGTIQTEKRNALKSVLHSVIGGVQRYHKFGCAIAAHLKIRKPKGLDTEKDWWKPSSRKLRKDRISEEVKENIKGFYLSPDVSREVPNKKDVLNQKHGEAIQRHVMTMTLSEAFEQYKKENPEIKIGYTSFKKLKPVNIRRVSEISHRSCLCQICCNLALKIQAVNKFAVQIENDNLKSKVKSWNKQSVSAITLCDYSQQDLPNAKCLDRKCDNCSPHLLSDHLQEALTNTSNDKITWYRWQYIIVETEGGIKKRMTSCVPHITTFREFITEMESDLVRYPGHAFRATWQHRQIEACIKSLQNEEVLMMMDYSENYRCRFQNEAQSAYFDQQQVTIHPFMCYYKTKIPHIADEETLLAKHAIIAISNDTNHDSFAVEAFEKKALDILKREKKEISYYS